MRHQYQINTEPSRQTVARMELMTHAVGAKKLAVVWHHFLSTHSFGDIDDAWANFEEWLHGTNENIKKFVDEKLKGKEDGQTETGR